MITWFRHVSSTVHCFDLGTFSSLRAAIIYDAIIVLPRQRHTQHKVCDSSMNVLVWNDLAWKPMFSDAAIGHVPVASNCKIIRSMHIGHTNRLFLFFSFLITNGSMIWSSSSSFFENNDFFDCSIYWHFLLIAPHDSCNLFLIVLVIFHVSLLVSCS